MEQGPLFKKSEGRGFKKPNNTYLVPTSTESDFFKRWCVFLRPFVDLTNREIDVVASFLKQRWELSKSIIDPAILDKMVMSDDTRRKVIKDCAITPQYFYVVLSALRKKGVITETGINPKMIPHMREDDGGVFTLLILFKEERKS